MTCSGHWVARNPLDIEFAFLKPWAIQAPLDIEFEFVCDGGGGPTYTDFDGYIESFTGESSSVDSINLEQALFLRAYSGETGTTVLLPTFLFNARTGELLGNNPLTTYPSTGLGSVDAHAGETGDGGIATTFALYPSAQTGEEGSGSLAVEQSLYPSAYSGEYSVAVVTENPAWTPTFRVYTGETGVGSLSTDSPFTALNGYGGELLDVVLTDYSADLLYPLVYVGELTEIGLATESTFTFRASSGETQETLLTTFPAPNMEASGHSGETSTFTFQIGRQLGAITGYSGENGSTAITNADNWIIKVGELNIFELATDPIFPMSHHGGEHASLTLRTGPSEPVGTLRAYSGEWVGSTLITMPSAVLQPNPILQWHDCIVGFDTGTSFDLLNSACCPVLNTYEHIELDEMEPPDIQYSGTKIIFTADLSTRPRFYLNAYRGERFDIVDPNWFDTFRVYTGEIGRSASPEFEFHDFNLCYGNLIPDSQFADVELVDLTSWECEAHLTHTGETLSLSTLQNNVQFTPQVGTGERPTIILTTDPAWLLFAYSGERFDWLNTDIYPRARGGESATLAFYEPPLDAYNGESATLVALTTEYAVAFSELGCLDNEFIPADEDGDPDPENANPIPIELDFFVHSIKARCF